MAMVTGRAAALSTMSSSRNAHGRVAVVTGAAAGIGDAIASRLVADGHRAVSLDIADPVTPRDGVIYLACDVSDRASVDSALAKVRSSVGAVSVVVHNAAYQMISPFEDLAPTDWERTFMVNVGGAFNVVQSALPDLIADGWGRVVCITSSSQWAPPPGMTHYVTSKGALTGFVRALAVELGPAGVTVNAVAPGLTATERAETDVPPEHFDRVLGRQAIKRTGTPSDIAGAVAFVVSADADFMTGQTVLVDGGEARM